ncbi:hypothetical protein D3C81_1366360 [compost metagenome]
MLAADAFELAEQRAFDLKVLDDGFDDQIAVGQGFDGFHRLQACNRRAARLGRQLAVLDSLAQLSVDAFNRLGGCAGTIVQQQDRMAGLGRHLGDTGTHGPGADHGDACRCVQCGHGSASLEAWGAFFHEGADAFAVVLAAPGQTLQVFFQFKLFVEAVAQAGVEAALDQCQAIGRLGRQVAGQLQGFIAQFGVFHTLVNQAPLLGLFGG